MAAHSQGLKILRNAVELAQKVNMGLMLIIMDWIVCSMTGVIRTGENIGARMAGDIMWAGYKERVMDYMKVTGSVGKNWIKIENQGTVMKNGTHRFSQNRQSFDTWAVCTRWLYRTNSKKCILLMMKVRAILLSSIYKMACPVGAELKP